ncbi:MAG: DUF1707 domain-containing protein [Actinobacteria bacterium]|nr:DUF1707 domain-containing protein [Actinomycetota bacterium]
MAASGDRVSDAARDRVVETLTRHMVAGTLTADELATRTDEAYAARTTGDLEHALRELPRLPRAPLLTRLADRVPLRAHVVAYAVASAILVAVWAATREQNSGPSDEGFGLLWPFWIMLAWGALLAAHALYALRRPAFERRGREPGR